MPNTNDNCSQMFRNTTAILVEGSHWLTELNWPTFTTSAWNGYKC